MTTQKIKEEQALMYISKFKRNLKGKHKNNAVLAYEILFNSGSINKFSTPEKSKKESIGINKNLSEKELEEVSSILNLIYNIVNSTPGYSSETMRELKIKRNKNAYRSRKNKKN